MQIFIESHSNLKSSFHLNNNRNVRLSEGISASRKMRIETHYQPYPSAAEGRLFLPGQSCFFYTRSMPPDALLPRVFIGLN